MNKLKIIKQSMAYIISAAMFASSVPVSAVEFSAGENSTLFGSGESYENQENEENFNNSLFTDEDKSVSTFNTESDEKSVQEKQSKTYIEWMLGENEITVETSQEEALPEGFVNYSYETKDEPGVNYETVNSLLSGKYEEGYDFKIMGYSLIAADMDTPLTMPEDASYKVTEFIAKDWSRDIKVFKYENNEFTEIEGVERVVESESVTNPHYTFSLSSLEGTYVLVSGMKEKKAEKQSKTYIEWMLGENEITVETSQEEALPEGFVNYSYETKDEPGTNYETVNGLLSKKYEEGYDFKIMGYSLIGEDMDTPLTMPEDASYKVTEFIAKDWSRDIKVFKYENNELTEIEGVERVVESESVTNPHYTFSLSSLEGTYVLVSGMKEKSNDNNKDNGPAYGTFEAGTYTISANLYVKGENNTVLPGTTAYLTNPNLPPLDYVTDNATMKVDEKGNITIIVDAVNNIFTIQEIESGSNVHIINKYYGPTEGTTEDDWLELTNNKYKGKYYRLEVQLNDMNGEYGFTGCKEYPVILYEDKEMPIHLGVDFSSAKRAFITDDKETFEQTYTDDKTGIAVKVKTTEESLGQKMKTAKLTVSEVEKERKEKIETNLSEYYIGTPSISTYDIALRDSDGNDLAYDGNTEMKLILPNLSDDTSVYLINDNNKGDVLSGVSKKDPDNVTEFWRTSLGTFALVDNTNTERLVSRKLQDTNTGASITAYVETSKVLQFGGVTMVASKTELDGIGNKWTICPTVGSKANSWSIDKSKFKFEIPVSDVNNSLYLVWNENEMTRVEKLNTYIDDGKVCFILARGLENRDDEELIYALFNGWYGKDEDSYTYSGMAYIIESGKKIVAPEYTYARGNELVYTGKEQTGILGQSNLYNIEGNKEINAGKYKAKVSLTQEAINDGYIWYTGSSEPIELDWEIKKAPLYCYSDNNSQKLKIGETPDWTIKYKGWVNGESDETVKVEYPEFQITEDSQYYEGKYDINGTCRKGDEITEYLPGALYEIDFVVGKAGSAQNYEFTPIKAEYKGPIGWIHAIIIAEYEGLSVPKSVSLKYTGKAQNGVADSGYYTLSGDCDKTEPGNYKTILTPKKGVRWEDGTYGTKEVSWSIEKSATPVPIATPTPTATPVPTATPTPTENKIDIPSVTTDLTYNGKEQTGVSTGEGYTLGGVYKATDAGTYRAQFMPKDNYTWKDGSNGVVTVEWTIARKAVELPKTEQDLTYNGKKQTGIKEGEGYTLTGDFTGKKVGKYTARAILSNNYTWKDGSTKAVTVKWSIAKADQKITVKKASASYKASALKKKDKTFQIGAKAKGKLTYKVTKAPKNASKYVTVNKNGKVTVKKNAPAGTWKITVTAASGSNYNKATKVITVKVKK